jgi:transcriptional regulator with XRE-family HTH domain
MEGFMQLQQNLAFNGNSDLKSQDAGSMSGSIDRTIGKLIRNRRNELRLSQTELGDTLGVSFQQIQKYEKGSNRVSASALYQIAGTLRVPVSFFFDLLPEAVDDCNSAVDAATMLRLSYIHTEEGQRLVDLFLRLPPSTRRNLFGLISDLAAPHA